MMNVTAKAATRKAAPTQVNNMLEKALSLTAETWNDIFQVLSVIAALIAFAALVGTAFTGRRVGQRQAAMILKLDKDVADARTKLAVAEAALIRVRNQQQPRSAATFNLYAVLKGKQTGEAEVLYQEGNREALDFANWLAGQLKTLQWRVGDPKPMGDMNVEAMPTGVTMIANKKAIDAASGAFNDLWLALLGFGLRVYESPDDSLPDGFVRIVVAQKE